MGHACATARLPRCCPADPLAKWLLRRRANPRSFMEVLRDMSKVSLRNIPRPPTMKEGEAAAAVELAAAGGVQARPVKAASAPTGFSADRSSSGMPGAEVDVPAAVPEDSKLEGVEGGGSGAANNGGSSKDSPAGGDSDVEDEAAAAGVVEQPAAPESSSDTLKRKAKIYYDYFVL